MFKRMAIYGLLLFAAGFAGAQERGGVAPIISGPNAKVCFESKVNAGPDVCIQRTAAGIVQVTNGISNTGGLIGIASSTVAALPAASSVSAGTLQAVTDASAQGSCTVGGGTQLALCRSNGSSWVSIGDGGGSSPTPSTIYAWDRNYGVQGTAFFACDATFVSGSNIVTTPATVQSFTGNPTRNAQVGDIVWGSNATCGGEDTGGSLNPTTLIAKGTITSVDSAHQVHVSNNASGNCTPSQNDNCFFVWGPDSDAGVSAAWTATAAGCGGTLILPAGGIILHTPPSATSNCSTTTANNGAPIGFTVMGQGQYSTMLLWDPSSLFANPAFTMTPANGGLYYMRYHDFGMMSGIASSAPLNNKSALAGTLIYNEFDHLFFNVLFPNNTGAALFTAITAASCGNCSHNLHDIVIESGGTNGILLSGDRVFLTNAVIQNESCTSLTVNPLAASTIVISNVMAPLGGNGCGAGAGGMVFTTGTGTVILKNSQFVGGGNPANAGHGVFMNGGSGAKLIAQDVTFQTLASGGAASGLNIAAGNTVILDGGSNLISAAGAASGFTGIANAGTLSLRNTTVVGATGGFALNNSGTVLVKEGNTFTNGITNTGTVTGQQGQGILYGSCTGVATASQTLTVFSLGETTATTCTVTGAGTIGQVMSKSGSASGLFVQAAAAGTNASSGAFTVFLNHNGTNTAQALTCTVGTGTSCNDGASAHAFAYVAGDIITVQFTTQAADTLANVRVQVVTQ